LGIIAIIAFVALSIIYLLILGNMALKLVMKLQDEQAQIYF
jgi:hypothetical protein